MDPAIRPGRAQFRLTVKPKGPEGPLGAKPGNFCREGAAIQSRHRQARNANVVQFRFRLPYNDGFFYAPGLASGLTNKVKHEIKIKTPEASAAGVKFRVIDFELFVRESVSVEDGEKALLLHIITEFDRATRGRFFICAITGSDDIASRL